MKSADLIESAKVELSHDLVHPFHNLKQLRVTRRDFHTEKCPAKDVTMTETFFFFIRV